MKQLLPLTLAALCLTTPAAAQITSFQHIIIVTQENRTPDNLFQGLCTTLTACSTKPSVKQYNIQQTGWLDKTSPTGMTNPTPFPFGVGYDLLHSHTAFMAECDVNMFGVCKMDGAGLEPCIAFAQPCPKNKPAFGYVDNTKGELDPYLALVKFYGWGNYFFQTNQGPSLAAHQFLFGATSAPSAADDKNGIFAASNSPTPPAGCVGSATDKVALINPQGIEFAQVFPCFEHQTLGDLLSAQGVSWRYYGPGGGSQWMAPNTIKHICVAVNHQCTGAEWKAHVEPVPSTVLSDISTNCKLRAVSWVNPEGENSDHMGHVQDTHGPSWVASIVNAVGNSKCTNPSDGSSYWNTTAIIITWDDWGGFYDHEPPAIEAFPQGGFQMGFRVPLIVVSAYTSPGFISNSREDFGSVMRFIERNFGIMEGALTFADARSMGDLREYFSLGNPANPFQQISAPLSATHFLTVKPAGIPPDDD